MTESFNKPTNEQQAVEKQKNHASPSIYMRIDGRTLISLYGECQFSHRDTSDMRTHHHGARDTTKMEHNFLDRLFVIRNIQFDPLSFRSCFAQAGSMSKQAGSYQPSKVPTHEGWIAAQNSKLSFCGSSTHRKRGSFFLFVLLIHLFQSKWQQQQQKSRNGYEWL